MDFSFPLVMGLQWRGFSLDGAVCLWALQSDADFGDHCLSDHAVVPPAFLVCVLSYGDAYAADLSGKGGKNAIIHSEPFLSG